MNILHDKCPIQNICVIWPCLWQSYASDPIDTIRKPIKSSPNYFQSEELFCSTFVSSSPAFPFREFCFLHTSSQFSTCLPSVPKKKKRPGRRRGVGAVNCSCFFNRQRESATLYEGVEIISARCVWAAGSPLIWVCHIAKVVLLETSTYLNMWTANLH